MTCPTSAHALPNLPNLLRGRLGTNFWQFPAGYSAACLTYLTYFYKVITKDTAQRGGGSLQLCGKFGAFFGRGWAELAQTFDCIKEKRAQPMAGG